MKVKEIYEAIYKLDKSMDTLNDKICLECQQDKVTILEREYEAIKKCKNELLEMDLSDLKALDNALVDIFVGVYHI